MTVGEPRFVVHASSYPGLTVREVRNDEPGSPKFGDDLVVYLVDMLLAIDSDGFVARMPRFQALWPASRPHPWIRRTTSRQTPSKSPN